MASFKSRILIVVVEAVSNPTGDFYAVFSVV